VAIKQRCPFCYEPLPVMKRADAVYCSPKCRKAAKYVTQLIPEEVKRTRINRPRLDYYPITMEVFRITWSPATTCDLCRRFITMGIGMIYFWGDLGPFGCGWRCLRLLLEREEFRADS
jgi:hypothetical protein